MTSGASGRSFVTSRWSILPTRRKDRLGPEGSDCLRLPAGAKQDTGVVIERHWSAVWPARPRPRSTWWLILSAAMVSRNDVRPQRSVMRHLQCLYIRRERSTTIRSPLQHAAHDSSDLSTLSSSQIPTSESANIVSRWAASSHKRTRFKEIGRSFERNEITGNHNGNSITAKTRDE